MAVFQCARVAKSDQFALAHGHRSVGAFVAGGVFYFQSAGIRSKALVAAALPNRIRSKARQIFSNEPCTDVKSK